MPYLVLVEGRYRVCAYTCLSTDWTARCDVLSFLHEKAQIKAYQGACRGYAALFVRYAEGGRQSLTAEMFHEVDRNSGIWQFTKGDLRLLCFIHENSVILTNGYVKKGQKVDVSEVSRAKMAKDTYLAALKGAK